MVSQDRSENTLHLTHNRYVLSPTHIHEFKSADRIYTQPPVMSLYLPEQKLGSRSQPGSSSHKFVVKGRQTGSMHRGHTWVFRAETYETMLAWFDDIKTLTEKSGEERNAFVRRHASVRSASAGSGRSRASSDGGLEEDEADAIPYSANHSVTNQAVRDESSQLPSRPSPGGRFPSDLMVNRNLQAPLSPSSGSSEVGNDLTSAAGGLQERVQQLYLADSSAVQSVEPFPSAQDAPSIPPQQESHSSYTHSHPVTHAPYNGHNSRDVPQTIVSNPYDPQPPPAQPTQFKPSAIERHDSNYGDWMGPAAGGAAAGMLASEAHHKKHMYERERSQQQELDKQTQLQNQEQHHINVPPRTMAFMDIAPTSVPERHPEHIAPDRIDDTGYVVPERHPEYIAPDQTDDAGHVAPPAIAPVSMLATVPIPGQTQPIVDGGLITPATTTESFLADSEAGNSVPFGKTINGGPVPVELVETARQMAHPGVMRQNTDISVSDLHVPGEYPKVKAGGPRIPMAE